MERIDIAGHDRLKCLNHGCSRRNWIDAIIRVCAVAADARYRNHKPIYCRRNCALPDADGIDQIGRIRMKAPDTRNRIECRRFQHFPCAQGGLFSWLEEKPHCPAELVLMFLQPDRSPDSRRDVKIVSAGVHLSRAFRCIR